MKRIDLCAAIFVFASGIALPATATAQEGGKKNILVFGDSITWGWLPTAPIVPTVRHAEEDRWPSIMQASLGDGYNVIAEGLSGRTTNVEDENAAGLMNGAEYLDSALMSHQPLDLVVIMLGTNDTKTYLDRSPLEIGLGSRGRYGPWPAGLVVAADRCRRAAHRHHPLHLFL